MSTPKISFTVPSADAEPSGDVTAHDISAAPGKEREREPVYGGQLANITEDVAVDAPTGGELTLPIVMSG